MLYYIGIIILYSLQVISFADVHNKSVTAGCWKEVLSSIQGATTPLRDCFYPEKYSLEDNLAEMLFLDGRNKRPDVLFDPVEYSRHLGLLERENYVTRIVGGSERYSLSE